MSNEEKVDMEKKFHWLYHSVNFGIYNKRNDALTHHMLQRRLCSYKSVQADEAGRENKYDVPKCCKLHQRPVLKFRIRLRVKESESRLARQVALTIPKSRLPGIHPQAQHSLLPGRWLRWRRRPSFPVRWPRLQSWDWHPSSLLGRWPLLQSWHWYPSSLPGCWPRLQS